MKDFVYLCLGVWFILCIVAFFYSSYEKDEQEKLIKIGDKVILGNDTLIVTKIELFDKTYLHNGAIIDTNFAIENLSK